MKVLVFFSVFSLFLPSPLFSQDSSGDQHNITDADRDLSRNYIHQLKGQRLINEGCLAGGNPDVSLSELKKPTKEMEALANELCGGQAKGKAFGLDEQTLKMVSKMWTLVIGAGGGGSGFRMKNLKDEANKATAELESAKEAGMDTEQLQGHADQASNRYEKHGENKKTDYCRYIPIGTESLATFQQATTNTHIVEHTHLHDAPQYAQIMRVARHYDARSANAKILTAGWGATAGCYATMMATSGGLMELSPSKGWSNYLKLGASAFMAVYYGKMIGIHGNRAEHMRKIAKALPKRGDCNPITDRNCFCTEPASKGDPQYLKYCGHFGLVPKGAPDDKRNKVRQGCIDADAKADEKCHCIAQDNCLNDGFNVLFKGANLPETVSSSFLGDIKKLSQGNAQSSMAKMVSTGKKHAANALNFFKKHVDKIPTDRPLSQNERDEMATLQSLGLPRLVARALALHRPSQLEQEAARKYLDSSYKKKSNRLVKKGTGRTIGGYSGGEGLRARKKRAREDMDNPFSKLLKKQNGKRPNVKVLHYAEKSQQMTGVHHSSDISLFEIISRRYQISGWENVQ